MNKDFRISTLHEYACIVIGDEILEGHVDESNVPLLISALSSKGYMLREIRIISDQLNDIAESLTQLRKRYSFVITIGGLGPTHDDRTMLGYANSFECETVLHKGMYEFLHRKPRETEEKRQAAIRMSTMPENIELILLDDRWPLLKMHNCYAMPGLPPVCKITIEKLAQILPVQPKRWYAAFFVNIPEHMYATWLSELAIQYATSIEFGSYPLNHIHDKPKGTDSKISLSGNNRASMDSCFESMISYLQKHKQLVQSLEIKEL